MFLPLQAFTFSLLSVLQGFFLKSSLQKVKCMFNWTKIRWLTWPVQGLPFPRLMKSTFIRNTFFFPPHKCQSGFPIFTANKWFASCSILLFSKSPLNSGLWHFHPCSLDVAYYAKDCLGFFSLLLSPFVFHQLSLFFLDDRFSAYCTLHQWFPSFSGHSKLGYWLHPRF